MTSAEMPVLFACTQNAVRSVMAKALFEKRLLSAGGPAVSCGLIEGPLDGFVVSVLAETGVDVSSHEHRFLKHLTRLSLTSSSRFQERLRTRRADGQGRGVQPCSGMSVRLLSVSVHARRLWTVSADQR